MDQGRGFLVKRGDLMNRRFPRLSAAQAKVAVAKLLGKSNEQLRLGSLVLPDLETERFAPTGMQRVSAIELKELQEQLRIGMGEARYPEGGVGARADVDRAIARTLAELGLPVGEMLRPDVWTWMTVHLVPDYLVWRWARTDGSITTARVSGSILRNALGRLWLRGMVFDLGAASDSRWSLMDRITEDAAVAILERTTVSSDQRVARAVAEAWIDTGSVGTAAEVLLRNTMVRFRVQAALIEAVALDDTELKRLVEDAFLQESGG